MSYVSENLMPNENVVCSAEISPAVFLRPVVSFIAFILLMAVGLSSRGASAGAGAVAVLALCTAAGFFVLTLSDVLRALIVIFTTEFAVTNRRVIAKRGLIRRHTLEMLLAKVESVGVGQDILGRLLDYGTVTVIGTGGTRERFYPIVSPLKLRMKINQIIESSARAPAPTAG